MNEFEKKYCPFICKHLDGSPFLTCYCKIYQVKLRVKTDYNVGIDVFRCADCRKDFKRATKIKEAEK